ncbi:DNA-processing protein DprA [Nocardioides plantarum]|uniref:DNA-processing protein DprA n=1 Tax=Nocardioides plantarum TaxID=29299 RepID=A0ABV5KAU1_9ACTN|nr:DNA-processing protein DprA [Nocardioides plantarum]
MSAPEAERLARVALSRLGEPGETRMTGLVAELGPVRLRDLLLAECDLQGLQTDVATRLAALDPALELDRAERMGLRFVVPGDAEWPTTLDDLAGAGTLHERGGVPIGLWVKGPFRLDGLAESLAVVGSRAATAYGDEVASEIAAAAAEAGLLVVSGGAFGIDRAAHRGAVSTGAPTVSVVACGADRVYPVAHEAMFAHIGRTGAIVSEAPPGCAPHKIRFLARNRLIAALTRGTVVVEAARRSGALNTANWAGRLNRHVMGVPGPVTSAASEGVHEQLRSGAMSLVTRGADVLEVVSPAGAHLVEPPRDVVTDRDRLTLRQRQVLDAVPAVSAAGSDSIARTAGLGLREVRGALGALEVAGFVTGDLDGWRLTELARA